ncbi:MAG: hypothetical protein V4494_01390 [Chlamydiota bacterium]
MFLQLFDSLFKKKCSSRIASYPKGECYDLQEIFNVLNEKYFDSKIDLPLKWFGNKGFRPRRRIVLGSYHLEKKIIKVHRVLDKEHVPHCVVSFIVYHEMLHHILPPKKIKNKRRKIHHPEFLMREKLFAEYVEAQEEIKKLLQGLWFVRKKKKGDNKPNKG